MSSESNKDIEEQSLLQKAQQAHASDQPENFQPSLSSNMDMGASQGDNSTGKGLMRKPSREQNRKAGGVQQSLDVDFQPRLNIDAKRKKDKSRRNIRLGFILAVVLFIVLIIGLVLGITLKGRPTFKLPAPELPQPAAYPYPDEAINETITPSIESQQIPIKNILDREKMAKDYFGNDWKWFYDNIPFLEIDDEQVQQIYYYRSHLFKSHLHDLGESYIITEFLTWQPWSNPITSVIVDAAGHHIYEGRWIRDRRYVEDYIKYWFTNETLATDNLNNVIRNYSAWLTDSMWAYQEVTGDQTLSISLFQAAKENFDGWLMEHYDNATSLFWQVPLHDATEFSVSAIETGNGWKGSSFRASINSYMFAEARALKKIADLVGDKEASDYYLKWQGYLRTNTELFLWNEDLNHFNDRYTEDYPDRYFKFNGYRELMGFIPWSFNLPSDDPRYAPAWQKIFEKESFKAERGLRTVEPRYPNYNRQYLPTQDCQWNGFSWPFHTTFVLDGMANIINRYKEIPQVNADTYYDQFKLYTSQHYQDKVPYVGEDTVPETGEWYANFHNRSEHYFHSQYVNLLITGLAGLRPRSDNLLEINPSISSSVKYFALTDIPYHGHNISIVWDQVNRYKLGEGYKIIKNDILIFQASQLQKVILQIEAPPIYQSSSQRRNLALNLQRSQPYPIPRASFSTNDIYLDNVIDGFVWNYTYPYNQWNNKGSINITDYFEIEFENLLRVSEIDIFFLEGPGGLQPPPEYLVLYQSTGLEWEKFQKVTQNPEPPQGNTMNRIEVVPQDCQKIRVMFSKSHNESYTGIAEIQVF